MILSYSVGEIKEMQVDEENNVGNAVEEIKTGRDLDALVAERVMGWKRLPDYNYWMTFNDGSFQLHTLLSKWNPSTDISFAMQVVEKMRFDGYHTTITVFMRLALCRISDWNDAVAEGEADFSVPEAICRAAIKATECLSISNDTQPGQASQTKE